MDNDEYVEDEEMQKMREQGICPHNELKCEKAKMCVLGKLESCSKLVSEEVTCCSRCKRKHKKQCTWKCFRFE
jgi:hypothetical protein